MRKRQTANPSYLRPLLRISKSASSIAMASPRSPLDKFTAHRTIWTDSRPPGRATATTGTTGPGAAPATPHTAYFPLCLCGLRDKSPGNHHSLAHQQGRLARRVHHRLPPPDRHLLCSIFDFRIPFQATEAVPCCCKRTTKSSVLS